MPLVMFPLKALKVHACCHAVSSDTLVVTVVSMPHCLYVRVPVCVCVCVCVCVKYVYDCRVVLFVCRHCCEYRSRVVSVHIFSFLRRQLLTSFSHVLSRSLSLSLAFSLLSLSKPFRCKEHSSAHCQSAKKCSSSFAPGVSSPFRITFGPSRTSTGLWMISARGRSLGGASCATTGPHHPCDLTDSPSCEIRGYVY